MHIYIHRVPQTAQQMSLTAWSALRRMPEAQRLPRLQRFITECGWHMPAHAYTQPTAPRKPQKPQPDQHQIWFNLDDVSGRIAFAHEPVFTVNAKQRVDICEPRGASSTFGEDDWLPYMQCEANDDEQNERIRSFSRQLLSLVTRKVADESRQRLTLWCNMQQQQQLSAVSCLSVCKARVVFSMPAVDWDTVESRAATVVRAAKTFKTLLATLASVVGPMRITLQSAWNMNTMKVARKKLTARNGLFCERSSIQSVNLVDDDVDD